ncbi:SRPBCC family protein [Streptomyces sp. NPDC046712]|uniref:SRPBCC family protein n=1 Tax=Streptomyces sp. NPDC046712 TaxID=3154802 RepID=UPI0033C2892F
MAKSDRDRTQESNAGLDQLFKELSEYLAAQADRLADKASDKLGGLTDQLYDVAEGGGKLSDVGGIGARLLQGKSPLKAIAGQSFAKLKDKVTDTASQVFGKGGKGRKSGGGKVVNIYEVADVGLPLRTVYDHWTQYENFSSFAKGVRDVSRDDETTSDWKLKVGPSSRSWKATVQEQVPDDHIIWTSEGAKGTTRGGVSFHELAPTLTRIVVLVEYHPAGMFEKTGNIWRAQGRRLRLDVKHFVRYVTLTTEEPEGWRGEIRDGEVVQTHEEALEEEEERGDEESEYAGDEGGGEEEVEEGEEGDEAEEGVEGVEGDEAEEGDEEETDEYEDDSEYEADEPEDEAELEDEAEEGGEEDEEDEEADEEEYETAPARRRRR